MFNTIDIFPTTILEFVDSDGDATCESLLKLLNDKKFTNQQQPTQTLDHHLELDPNFNFFYSWANQCLSEFHQAFQFDCDRFEIVLSWANRCEPLGAHRAHTHPNSFISGIYYLTDSVSSTCFEDPRHNINLFSVATPSNWDVRPWTSPSKKGTLVLFPSWLSHFTTTLPPDSEPRYTISFNVLPRGLINGKTNPLTQITI